MWASLIHILSFFLLMIHLVLISCHANFFISETSCLLMWRIRCSEPEWQHILNGYQNTGYIYLSFQNAIRCMQNIKDIFLSLKLEDFCIDWQHLYLFLAGGSNSWRWVKTNLIIFLSLKLEDFCIDWQHLYLFLAGGSNSWRWAVSYTHLTLPTICSV